MFEIQLGVIVFTTIVLALVGVILLARSGLVASGKVNITINDQPALRRKLGLT